MAKWLNDTGVVYLISKIKLLLTDKVDKVEGKGLSSNDFTTEEKTKLAGIAAEANKYELPVATASVLGGVKVGKNLTISADGVLDATAESVDPATEVKDGLMSKEDKKKLNEFGAASTYALKTDITGLYKYKGSVNTVADLPSTGNTNGDVWDVKEDGMNYAWDGSKWDALGGTFTITAMTNEEIDDAFK